MNKESDSHTRRGRFRLFSGICLGAAILMLWQYPLHPEGFALFYIIYAAVLYFFPASCLFWVPALLPVFDFAPWSGWSFFDAFDILLLVTLGMGYWTLSEGGVPDKNRLHPVQIIFILLVASTAVSTVYGLFPLEKIQVGSFADYFSPYNSLRGFKGFAWPFVFLPILNHWSKNGGIRQYLIPGLLAGLTGLCLSVLWERQVFTGLLNVSSEFRVVGMFSGMHIGGAPLDAYLSLTIPFVFSCFFLWKNRWVKVLGGGGLCLSLYTLFVTYSRIVYFSFFLSGIVILVYMVCTVSNLKRFVGGMLLISFLGALIMIPISQGGFIRKRFSQVEDDLRYRIKNWQHASRLIDNSALAAIFGMGLGSYPRRNAQKQFKGENNPFYQFSVEENNLFLKLPALDRFYWEQRIPIKPQSTYILEVDLRSDQDGARVNFVICEKSILYSFQCSLVNLQISRPGQWNTFRQAFQSETLGSGNPIYQRRPVNFGVFNASKGIWIDIDNIRLFDEAGRDIIKNGSFESGNDFWFFSTDNHDLLHISNLWMHLIFEHGWLGFCLFNIFIIVAIFNMVKSITENGFYSVMPLSGVFGILGVGMVDSLLDFPRITMILFFLILSSCRSAENEKPLF